MLLPKWNQVNAPTTVAQKQLAEFLVHVAVVRLVFIWGPPGIGRSALVQQFAEGVFARHRLRSEHS